MKTIFKFLKWTITILVVLLVTAVLARNFIVRVALQIGVRQATGFPLSVGAVDIGLFNSKLEVRDVKLSNPKEFVESRFVDLPRVYVDYHFGSMFRRMPHVQEMEIQLNEVVLVKNAGGVYNVQVLKNVGGGSDDSETTESPDEKKMPYRVDTLHLKVGQVVIKDYSKATPMERIVKLNLNVTYKDITESTDIGQLVLGTVLKNVGIPDLSGLTEQLNKNIGGLLEDVKGVGEKLQETHKKLLDMFKKK